MRRLVIIWVCLAAACVCEGRTITVDDNGPADFNNIQAAINDANEEDTIIVAEGRYYENIHFGGKDIVLRSTDPTDSSVVEKTVIDGRFLDSVVMFSGTESAACVLSGFRITKGLGHGPFWDHRGGGIYGNGTLATIEHNMVLANWAAPDVGPGSGLGGGIYDCDGIIRYNRIADNGAFGDMGEVGGGGLYGCDGIIRNNVISSNSMGGCCGGGGGLAGCNGDIQHNVIYSNSARWGGGLYSCNGSIINCIIWENTAQQGSQVAGFTIPSYSCIQDWWGGGIGNMNTDPCFADAETNDFHLKSQAGRWDPNSETWVQDDVTSPCIDAGDPMSPVGLEPFPNGGIVNMGAYGGTVEASKSYFGDPVCETIFAGDINGDCKVDFLDFRIMSLHWLWQE